MMSDTLAKPVVKAELSAPASAFPRTGRLREVPQQPAVRSKSQSESLSQAEGHWIRAESQLAAELSYVCWKHWIVKRIMDVTLATMALLVPLPFLLLVALAIRLTSSGPVIYKQKRVGSNWGWRARRRSNRSGLGPPRERTMCMWKFRTMYQHADEHLSELLDCNSYADDRFVKIENDPRITPVGRFLRRYSLDEWPQFVNVLRGEMSVIGNRPLPVYEAEHLSEAWQKIRFASPAGITGLWQVSGRSDLSAQDRIDLDNYYALKNALDWSLWDDVRIALRTPWVMLTGKGAR